MNVLLVVVAAVATMVKTRRMGNDKVKRRMTQLFCSESECSILVCCDRDSGDWVNFDNNLFQKTTPSKHEMTTVGQKKRKYRPARRGKHVLQRKKEIKINVGLSNDRCMYCVLMVQKLTYYCYDTISMH